MKVTLELKFVEFRSNDPKMKAELKALREQGWHVQDVSVKRSRTKKFRLKKLSNEAV